MADPAVRPDVASLAAEFARDLFTSGEPRRFAYLVLRDTPGNAPGEGGSWSERAVAGRVAAALARALAGDGEPVAYGYMVVGADSRRELVRFSDDDMSNSECKSALESAELVCRVMNESDFAHAKPYRVVPLFTRPAATGDTGEVDCPHHSETGLGGCGRFAWHCDGCGRIRWIYDASKGIGSRADVPRGVVLEGPPTTAVEIARRMLTLGDVALLLERAGSSDDEQGSAQRTLLRLEALRNALAAAEATRAATGGPDAR